jgi:predicted nucleic acid-binding protein
MKIYLDNNIVSAIVKDDYPDESAALDKLLESVEARKLEIVTSELTRREIERYQGSTRKAIDRVYRLREKVSFLDDHTVLGFHSEWHSSGGASYPLVEDDVISVELRRMGLGRTDAHHLMLAIRAKCDVFLTCDEKTILKHRAAIEARFPIKLKKPSEL